MLGIYIASGVIVCLGIAIAVFNRIEKLKRTIEAKQADLEEAKAESIRKENRLLVSFTEQSADFRKKMEMAEDELHFVKDQYDEMLKDQTTLTEDRDKWKAKAEVATTENNDLKQTKDSLSQECDSLQQALQTAQAQKEEWEEKYTAESARWDAQKRALVGQLRQGESLEAPQPAAQAEATEVVPKGDPTRYHLCDGVIITYESMVAGEPSPTHPSQLTNTLLYDGFTTINPLCGSSRSEHDSYPALMLPRNGAAVLSPVSIQRAAEHPLLTALRTRLKEALAHKEGIRLLGPVALPVRGRTYGYVAELAIYVQTANLYVSIQIDAPYTLSTRQPLHAIGGADLLHDLYFAENGWAVFRVAEQQLAEHPAEVDALLMQQLALMAGRLDLYREADAEAIGLDRWTASQADEMAQAKQREGYLPQPAQAALRQLTPTPFEGESPAADILAADTASLEKQLKRMKGHPYTKVSVRTNDYEYLFMTGSEQPTTQGYERGWFVTDIIEEKKVFIPLSDITALTALDQPWLYPELAIGDELSMADWDQLGAWLKEAAYGSRPISLQYKEGDTLTEAQNVLYLTHLFTLPHSDETVGWQQASALLFSVDSLKDDLQNFTGYLPKTADSRSFNAYQVKRIGLYNCHKPAADYGMADLLNCVQTGATDVMKLLYDTWGVEKRYKAALL